MVVIAKKNGWETEAEPHGNQTVFAYNFRRYSHGKPPARQHDVRGSHGLRQRARGDGPHAPHPSAAHSRRELRADSREVRGTQRRRFDQDAHGVQHDPPSRATRRDRTRQDHHHRADERQPGHWPGPRGRGTRLRRAHHHARFGLGRASQDLRGLRCADRARP